MIDLLKAIAVLLAVGLGCLYLGFRLGRTYEWWSIVFQPERQKEIDLERWRRRDRLDD